MGIVWSESIEGSIGILPCGFYIVVKRVSLVAGRVYTVSFGTAELQTKFSDLEEARMQGVLLARRILTECLLALES